MFPTSKSFDIDTDKYQTRNEDYTIFRIFDLRKTGVEITNHTDYPPLVHTDYPILVILEGGENYTVSDKGKRYKKEIQEQSDFDIIKRPLRTYIAEVERNVRQYSEIEVEARTEEEAIQLIIDGSDSDYGEFNSEFENQEINIEEDNICIVSDEIVE